MAENKSKTKMQLIAELEEMRQQRSVEKAAERIREEVLAMRSSDYLLKVVVTLFREIIALDLKPLACTFHFVDEEADRIKTYGAAEHPRKYGIPLSAFMQGLPGRYEIDEDIVGIEGEQTISQFLSSISPSVPDYLERWHARKVWSHREAASKIRHIRDKLSVSPELRGHPFFIEEGIVTHVPFRYGTVAIKQKESEHTEEHITVLQALTKVLSLGYLRFLDLQSLEEINEKLEKRVAERTAQLKEALGEVEELKNRLQEENIYLQQEIKLNHNFEEIICQSESFDRVLEAVEQVAGTDATVLILGETGTGKELLARAVHSASQRKDRPLVKVNCAALPATLIESELFGHERGAFTGALTRKSGRFELADGGTLFLDEIGDLPLELQTKLLRVLQDGEFQRLGGTSTLQVDVRVITATHRNLEEAVTNGDFREDLFYRLNVFPIICPPLRERKEDIPLLVEHFIGKYSAKTGKKIDTVSHKVMDALQAYDWPGNVRELENIVERAVIVSRETQLELGNWLRKSPVSSGPTSIPTLEENEREHILAVLEQTGWRVRGERGAAELLRIKPTTLESRMKKLKIERQP
jgi:formate hydrogenlyase transcriptional activator